MSSPLDELAREVGVNERTLRRAVASGLLRGRRSRPRRIALQETEATWIRSHWPLIGRLRAVLRTEPKVALAVLFGSVARGDEVEGISDIDILVELRSATPGALEALNERLSGRLGLAVQLVPLHAARRDPQLLDEILRDGRPLVDRESVWPRLWAEGDETHRRAAAARDQLRHEAQLAVDYFRRLAQQRTSPPLATGQ